MEDGRVRKRAPSLKARQSQLDTLMFQLHPFIFTLPGSAMVLLCSSVESLTRLPLRPRHAESTRRKAAPKPVKPPVERSRSLPLSEDGSPALPPPPSEPPLQPPPANQKQQQPQVPKRRDEMRQLNGIGVHQSWMFRGTIMGVL